MAMTDTVVIERVAEAVARRFQSNHGGFCQKEGIIAEIEAKADAAKENSQRLEAALTRMTAAVTANAQDIAVVKAGQDHIIAKAERKMYAIIFSLITGGAGGGAAVAAILNHFKNTGGTP